ncbi:MAG TPA: pirin-like C-terminal cupin domain-containing protein, partial [Rhizomicrobium sp.]|nr:pirin-like C-terminal cupin domain-containing protein [Rhizomicrobium sp.]
ARFDAGGALAYATDHQERAFLVIEGEVETGPAQVHGPGAMLVLEPGEQVTLYAGAPARVMLLGGAPLDGPRHIWWNFVSSSRERIERAKQDWADGRFGLIPGDDKEFIPLPPNR